jgi:hypothetical protein
MLEDGGYIIQKSDRLGLVTQFRRASKSDEKAVCKEVPCGRTK